MNGRSIGLVVLLASIFIVEAGCKNPQNPNILAANPHRVVTISSVSPGASNPCEADFPVTLLTRHKNQTIAWAAADHDYWIQFANGSPIGADNINIKVPSKGHTDRYSIAPTVTVPQYYMYAIYDVDPTTNSSAKACKAANDDHDTGLNVKP